MTTTTIPFNKLETSALNVRQVAARGGADKELVASIEAHGVLQNLIVHETKKGRYGVAAGGRRFKALAELVKAGKLPKTYPVPCRVAESEEQAIDWSLVENFARVDMHPADTVAAFDTLAKNGKSEKDIASEFGLPVAHVKRVLKLARVSPVLIAEFRADKLTMEQMQAFVLADSHEKQEACWDSLKSQGSWAMQAHNIRKHITGQAITAGHRLVKLIGLAAYKKAGGVLTEDLFEQVTYLNDSELVYRLAEEKLQADIPALQAEGWKWVDVMLTESYVSYGVYAGRTHAEQVDVPEATRQEQEDVQKAIDELLELENDGWTAEQEARHEALEVRADELEQEIAGYAAFTDEQKATAGVVLLVGQDGTVMVERGYRKADDMKAAKRQQQTENGDEGEQQDTPRESAALRESLNQYKLQAMQAELMNHPALAFDLLVFTLADRFFSRSFPYSRPVNANIEQAYFDKIEPDTKAAEAMEKAKAGLERAWVELDSSEARYQAFAALPTKAKQKIMAVVVAGGLRADDDFTPGVAQAMQFQLQAYWQPTADNYFKRLKTGDLLTIGEAVVGADWLNNARRLKKADVVVALADNPAMAEWMPEI